MFDTTTFVQFDIIAFDARRLCGRGHLARPHAELATVCSRLPSSTGSAAHEARIRVAPVG